MTGGYLGIRTPFEVGLALMTTATIYSTLFLPYIKPAGVKDPNNASPKGFAALMGPTRMLLPQKWCTPDGRIRNHWGTTMLGVGVYLGTVSLLLFQFKPPSKQDLISRHNQLATGYIPTLIQMYSTSAFGFGPTENGFLMSSSALIRGCFLSLAFPRIISAGRKWFASRETATTSKTSSSTEPAEHQEVSAPTDDGLEIVAAPEIEQEPAPHPKAVSTQEGSAFDLFFLKRSLVVDGILTAFATFTKHGWQIYLGTSSTVSDSQIWRFYN